MIVDLLNERILVCIRIRTYPKGLEKGQGVIPDFELVRPNSVAEAMNAMADGGIPYIGGTELVAAMQIGLFAPESLVDLKRIPELSGISSEGQTLRIGAATLHDDIAANELVRHVAPILAEVCSLLGNQRVRATGSIGGNVCFADYRSDVITALFALHASVILKSLRGTRKLPITEFVLGTMDVNREDDELLVAFEIPLLNREQIYVRHQPAEYPTLCVAVTRPHDGQDEPVEVVVGAAVDRPAVYTFNELDDVEPEAISRDSDVIEDLNGSKEYKQHLISVFVRRACEQVHISARS